MVNYGIILTPLGIIANVLGGVALGTAESSSGISAQQGIGIGLLVVGTIFLFAGLARLVQGKNPKIYGKFIRPKAAARSSLIWALLFFNITPFLLIDTTALQFISINIPFPFAILFLSNSVVYTQYYPWMPWVFLGFHIAWLVFLFLSRKIPKVINIIMNFVITLSLSFWLAFGSQFLLWTFLSDKSNLVLLESFNGVETFGGLAIPLVISAVIIVFALVFMMRMFKNLQLSFSNLSLKGGRRIFSFIFLLLLYLFIMVPMVFGIYTAIQVNSFIWRYANYIGVVFLAIGIFNGLTTLLNAGKEMGRQLTATGDDRAAKGVSFGIKSAIFVLVFFLAWAPMILPLVDRGLNNKNNSIYNTNWNGWSNFRDSLETKGYTVRSVQSSISTISELDQTKQIVLVAGGPNVFYNPASEIPFLLTAFKTNFSMMICDDHGTAGTLLIESFVASLGATGSMDSATPITFFPNGELIDNQSYWINPTFPVIQDISQDHPIGQGVNSVVLGQATGFLGGEILSGFGWTYIGQTSGHYSFIDTNGDHRYDADEDTYNFPGAVSGALQNQGGTLGLMGTVLNKGLPLGGYAQAVFSIKELAHNAPTPDGNGTFSSRMFCATDATWLNNELTSVSGFDNMKMGLQTVEWLACGRDPEDTIVVFDEAHIAPDTPTWNVGRTEMSSAASFGAVQQYLNWMSTNPILGLVYPLFALQTFRKWIPKEGNKKKVQLQDLEEIERDRLRLKFRTSSFFAQKINWYRQYKRYRLALLQLFRRLERKVNRILSDSGDRSLEALMYRIQAEHGSYYSEDVYKRIETFFEKMFRLKAGKEKVQNEQEFEMLFYEMDWVSRKI